MSEETKLADVYDSLSETQSMDAVNEGFQKLKQVMKNQVAPISDDDLDQVVTLVSKSVEVFCCYVQTIVEEFQTNPKSQSQKLQAVSKFLKLYCEVFFHMGTAHKEVPFWRTTKAATDFIRGTTELLKTTYDTLKVFKTPVDSDDETFLSTESNLCEIASRLSPYLSDQERIEIITDLSLSDLFLELDLIPNSFKLTEEVADALFQKPSFPRLDFLAKYCTMNSTNPETLSILANLFALCKLGIRSGKGDLAFHAIKWLSKIEHFLNVSEKEKILGGLSIGFQSNQKDAPMLLIYSLSVLKLPYICLKNIITGIESPSLYESKLLLDSLVHVGKTMKKSEIEHFFDESLNHLTLQYLEFKIKERKEK